MMLKSVGAVMATAAFLLCAGDSAATTVMKQASVSAELRVWLEKNAGLGGTKLTNALALCADEDIESIADLREVNEDGRLEQLGFKKVALGRIERALKGAPHGPQPTQPRRMQDGQQQGSSCVDAQGEFSRLWAQVDAALAHAQNAVLPIGMIIEVAAGR